MKRIIKVVALIIIALSCVDVGIEVPASCAGKSFCVWIIT